MKDNLQLIGQIILIILGPILFKHGITLGNDEVDKIVGALADLAGIIWKFWHWNKPDAPTTTGTGTLTGTLRMIAFFAVLAFMWGCAAIQQGQDPIVVTVERTQTVAAPTFDLVLGVDNSQRSLWRDKAPAFHDFCEWLRQTQNVQLVDGTSTNVQRAIAMQLNLDRIKLDYKASKTTSNAVLEAMATLQSAVSQAGSWLNVITNPVPQLEKSN